MLTNLLRLGTIGGALAACPASMIIRRSYVYRLDPTPEQETFFSQTAGACRALYNLALEQRSLYQRPGRKITYLSHNHVSCPICAPRSIG